MKSQNVANVLLVSLLVSTGAIAETPPFKITGSIPTTVTLQQTNSNAKRSLTAAPAKPRIKQISLERVELSPEAQDYLASQVDKPNTVLFAAAAATTALPPSAELGMNNVPVLDQGRHGTCVTFADTGAVDAIHGNTDYISQLCNLELGSYLETVNAQKKIEYPSGWDGSLNDIVLKQMQKYGIITMSYQQQYGCGNSKKLVKAYPLNDENDKGTIMNDAVFTKHSELIMKDIYLKSLLKAEDAYTPKAKMDTVVTNIKQAITNSHRVVFGTLLDVNDELEQVNGATGTFKNVSNDAWVVTPKVKSDLKAKRIKAGHAMIITGYDDNAEIVGADGVRHTGAFMLRNSWSSEAGNSGTYYMSYEYFKLLAMEAIEISPTPIS